METHRVPFRYLLLFLFCFIASFTLKAQYSKFFYKQLPSFSQGSPGIFVYSIPPDSVASVIYSRRGIPDPGSRLLRSPVAVIPYDKRDSILSSDLLSPGYYALINIERDMVRCRFFRKEAFYTKVIQLGGIQILELIDRKHDPVRNAVVDICGRPVPYNKTMLGYVIENDYLGDSITIRYGGDIEFYSCRYPRKPEVRVSQPSRPSEVYRDVFDGYLVTNKPKYLPGDTVKYKAYILGPDGEPFRGPLRVKLTGQYNPVSRTNEIPIVNNLRPEAPGVYFSEFVLGDSILIDKRYTLQVEDERSGRSLTQQFETQDYVLNEINLKLKVPKMGMLHQRGDSVHIYAYAYDANNLPVLDGNMQLTVRAHYADKDTLLSKEETLDPTGETYLGFSTEQFPDMIGTLGIYASLTNTNMEKKEAFVSVPFTFLSAVIKTSQKGNVLTAELFNNGRPVKGKGWYSVNGSNTVDTIYYPYALKVKEHDRSFVFGADSIDTMAVYVSRVNNTPDSLMMSGSFAHDTASLSISNPQHAWLRYTVYIGKEYAGQGAVNNDTVLKFYSRKGETVTLFTNHTWVEDFSRVIPIYKYDKAMEVTISKKDYVYPGQTDSIRINLLNAAGKPVSNTNVTVLAFNAQFEENFVPQLPYIGSLRPALTGVDISSISKNGFTDNHAIVMKDRRWLQIAGLDTSVFYNDILQSAGPTVMITYPMPGTELPQLGVHIYKGGQFIKPVIIYIDDRPVYFRGAVSVNPQAFYVTEGTHKLQVRTATGLYDTYITITGGLKHDIFIKADNYPLSYKVEMSRELIWYEKRALANVFLQYRPYPNEYRASYTSAYGSDNRQVLLQQYPVQYKFHNDGYSTTLVGPFNFNDSIAFYQYLNTKRSFMGEPDYATSISDGLIRLEKIPTEHMLANAWADEFYWPDLAQKVDDRINMDKLQVWECMPRKSGLVKGSKGVNVSTMVKYIKPELKKDKGVLEGIVLDEMKEPIIGAIVQVLADGIVKGGAATDVDGEFRIAGLKPGRYDVKVSFASYVTQLVHNVMIYDYRRTDLQVQLRVSNLELNEVVVTSYKVPLIDMYQPGGSRTMTAEQIETMPTRTTDGVTSTSAGVYSNASSGLSIAGGRDEGTLYIVDGVQLRGSAGRNVPMSLLTDQSDALPESRLSLPSPKAQVFISEFMNNMMNASGGRKNFRDWAIWEPNLWTDKKGNTSFKVTYPDNTTAWNTYVLAMNQENFTAQSFSLTRAFKPLSAQLSIPRFLLYGDSVTGIGKVMNYTETGFGLKTVFAQDGKELHGNRMVVNNVKIEQLHIAAPKGTVDTLSTTLMYGIKADNGYSDGEERTIPVYPVGVVTDKGDFFEMITDTVVRSAPLSNSHFTGKTIIQVDGSMLELMLREIENLKEYPHGCTEQLTTKLLAISYEESVKRILNNEKLNNTQTKKAILEKLITAQNRNGSFGWFSANSADYRITNYVISTMMKVNSDGWLSVVINRGLDFLYNDLDNMDLRNRISALSTLSAAGYKMDYKKQFAQLDTLPVSLYDSFALVNIKREQSLNYRPQLDSLVCKARMTNKGMNWGYRSYDWYRDDLATTLLAYKIIKDDSIYSHLKKPIVRYILSRRKNGYYNSTAESGLVLTALLPDLLKQSKQTGAKTKVIISGSRKDTVTSFPRTIKLVDKNASFSFEKAGFSPAYVSVIYKYLDTTPKTDSSSFKVSTLFLSGKDTVASLIAGEKFILRTTVKVVKESEYVMIEVPIPAGCIQVKSKNGNAYYYSGEANRENYKDRTNIFCSKLTPGTYTFDVELEARYKGRFTLNPAKAGMMYQPDEYGNNEPKTVMIK